MNHTIFSFDISNTDHVKPVKLLDRISFVCPDPNLQADKYEYTKLYAVLSFANSFFSIDSIVENKYGENENETANS